MFEFIPMFNNKNKKLLLENIHHNYGEYFYCNFSKAINKIAKLQKSKKAFMLYNVDYMIQHYNKLQNKVRIGAGFKFIADSIIKVTYLFYFENNYPVIDVLQVMSGMYVIENKINLKEMIYTPENVIGTKNRDAYYKNKLNTNNKNNEAYIKNLRLFSNYINQFSKTKIIISYGSVKILNDMNYRGYNTNIKPEISYTTDIDHDMFHKDIISYAKSENISIKGLLYNVLKWDVGFDKKYKSYFILKCENKVGSVEKQIYSNCFIIFHGEPINDDTSIIDELTKYIEQKCEEDNRYNLIKIGIDLKYC